MSSFVSNGSVENVFVAKYNETSVEDIVHAVENRNIICIVYDNDYYVPSQTLYQTPYDGYYQLSMSCVSGNVFRLFTLDNSNGYTDWACGDMYKQDKITYSNTDLTAGTSSLTTGTFYAYYV